MQHEIKQMGQLLDLEGNLMEPGFSKQLLSIYRREAIKVSKLRIKEWDYYYIGNDEYGIALTIADNSYMGLDSITFFDFIKGEYKTKTFLQVLTLGKKNLPSTSKEGMITSGGKKYNLSFSYEEGVRILKFFCEDFSGGKPISGEIRLSEEPKESMVIATPFDKRGHFYFNQKINCLRAEGWVHVKGHEFDFHKENSFAVLDWGRGVWTYSNTWYWGSASGVVNQIPFGFNIGYGFGNTKAASENMLIYDGKAHKLDQITFHIPKDKNGMEQYLKPWHFTSNDGRFEMKFEPILDRSSKDNLLFLVSNQHQVFGKFTGKAILDQGQVIEIKDFMGFAEKVQNKW